MSTGYTILSREHSKTSKLTEKCIITSAGMVTDIECLHKTLALKVKQYKTQFGKEPSAQSLAKLLSNTLYSRRFMPYYSFNLLCGLDEEGKGIIYGYDAIGSFDAITYGVQGSGSQLGAPILDNQFKGHNFLTKQLAGDQQDAVDTAKDIINGIAERDIYTGDGIEIWRLTAQGVLKENAPLRRD